MAHRGRHRAMDAVALALATGQSVRDAAAAAGLGERTLHRWLTDPEFRALVAAKRGEIFDVASRRLAALGGESVDVLGRLLRSESETMRHKAASTILQTASAFREQHDVGQRLAELERFLGARGEQP